MGGHNEIGNGQSLTDEVGIVKQVLIKILENSLDGSLCSIDTLFVVWVSADGRTEPCTKGGEDFRVGERAPLQDLSVGSRVLGDEGGIGILFSHCKLVMFANNIKSRK